MEDFYGSEKIEDRIKRIRNMEKILDKADEIIDSAMTDSERFFEYQSEIIRLERYYTGPEWKEDFALDEAGRLPLDLKRGVLSEDGIYNLLEKNREMLERLKETEETDLRAEFGKKTGKNKKKVKRHGR